MAQYNETMYQGCEKEQELPGHAPLQSVFLSQLPCSLLYLPRALGTATPLQQVDSLCLCKCDGHEYFPQSSLLCTYVLFGVSPSEPHIVQFFIMVRNLSPSVWQRYSGIKHMPTSLNIRLCEHLQYENDNST